MYEVSTGVRWCHSFKSTGFEIGQEIRFLRHRAWNVSVTLNFSLFEFLFSDI